MSYFTKSKTTKVVAGVIGFTMALSLFVGVGAQTTNAQGISLSQLVELFISLGIISSDKADQARAAVSGYATPSYTFTLDLKQGDRGTEVMNLQKVLNADSRTQVASSGAGSPGNESSYFGSLTKKALINYQIIKGVSATGMVDAATRAALNTVSTPVSSSSSSSVTTTSSSSSSGTVAGDGKDGSITISLDSSVGNQTLKKGETKDVYAVKAQATAGDVTISRFDVRLNQRPWLYLSKLTLKTSDGTVIAEKNISSASDATEITVGSDYLVRFEGVNFVVKPGADKILVVGATVLASTDKLGSDVSMTVKTGTSGIRTINGLGYTDSLSETTGRTVTLSSSGSTGNIAGRVNSGSPAAKIVTVTTTGETPNVVLGMFDFKSANQPSTLNTLRFTMNDKSGQKQVETILKRVRLTDGTNTYTASTLASTTIFTNLNIPLALDVWKTLTLTADVADADDFDNGSMASTSMVVNATNIVGIDSNYTTVTASGANTIASNDITYLQSGAQLSGMSTVITPIDNGTAASATSTVKFVFTLQNTGISDLYVSKTPSTLVATSTTTNSLGSLTLLSADTATLSGDSSTVYIIPSGSSRKFTLDGSFGKYATSGTIEFKVTKVYFDDDTTGLQEFNIDFGLENLRAVNTW